MVSIILVFTSFLVLIIAGILLAKGHKKDAVQEIQNENKEQSFNTKYDELIYLYKNGIIKEEEYKNQMKNLIN